MGLDRRQLLGGALGGLAALALPARAARRPRKLLLILANGGWDTTFVFDDKLGNPNIDGPWVDQDPADPLDQEVGRRFGELSIVTNEARRPAVSRFFEAWGDRVSLLNGVWTGTIAHDPARYRVLTGSSDLHRADLTTLAGATLGRDAPLGSVDLCGLSYTGPYAASTGQVGYQSQARNLVLPADSFRPPADHRGPWPAGVPTEDELLALRQHLSARTEAVASRQADPARLLGRLEALERAERFRRESPEALASLELGARPTFQRQVDVALSLLSRDLCGAVLAEAVGAWDTHRGNVDQHGLFDLLFLGLNNLAADLVSQGLWDDTLVVVTSEMARTPKVNETEGKDHWPQTSFLVFGGGVPGGKLYGATDDLLEAAPCDPATGKPDPAGEPLRYDQVAASILAALDIDPAAHFPGVAASTFWFDS